jgi:hypothetical protein
MSLFLSSRTLSEVEGEGICCCSSFAFAALKTLTSYPHKRKRDRYTNPMFIHMFSFRWKPGITEQQKQRVFDEVNALKDQIPGILDSAVGFNTSPHGQGYEFGGVMKFSNRAAYDAYNAHPVHQQLLTWLLPLIDPMELDFEL